MSGPYPEWRHMLPSRLQERARTPASSCVSSVPMGSHRLARAMAE